MTKESRLGRILNRLHTAVEELQSSVREINELLGETAAEVDFAQWKRGKFIVIKGGYNDDQL